MAKGDTERRVRTTRKPVEGVEVTEVKDLGSGVKKIEDSAWGKDEERADERLEEKKKK